MTIQTNPEMFSPRLPVHTVTHIDRVAGVTTLTGLGGSSQDVPLRAWGPFEAAQPAVGSKVQLLS
jgi:hypothetical protein